MFHANLGNIKSLANRKFEKKKGFHKESFFDDEFIKTMLLLALNKSGRVCQF